QVAAGESQWQRGSRFQGIGKPAVQRASARSTRLLESNWLETGRSNLSAPKTPTVPALERGLAILELVARSRNGRHMRCGSLRTLTPIRSPKRMEPRLSQSTLNPRTQPQSHYKLGHSITCPQRNLKVGGR